MTPIPLYTAWPRSPRAMDPSIHLGSIGHLRRQIVRTYARFEGFAVGLIVRGSGTYRVDGQPTVNVSAGSVISVYPGAVFDYGPTEWWEEYYVGFSGKGAGELLMGGLIPTGTPLRRVNDIAPKIAAFEEVLRIWRRDGPGDADRASLLGRLLLVDLLSDVAAAAGDPVDAVLQHCRQHFAGPIDFQTLADRHDMSYSFLRQAIRKRTGLAPSKFLTRLRCDAANILLATTRLAVKEVGVRVGISDPYTFSRTFSRTTGQSPDAYRRLQRVYPMPASAAGGPGESPQV
ncbi:MAG TPA: AraC family transcriptional regulator [Tepidisphaeraceae bacterium]